MNAKGRTKNRLARSSTEADVIEADRPSTSLEPLLVNGPTGLHGGGTMAESRGGGNRAPLIHAFSQPMHDSGSPVSRHMPGPATDARRACASCRAQGCRAAKRGRSKAPTARGLSPSVAIHGTRRARKPPHDPAAGAEGPDSAKLLGFYANFRGSRRPDGSAFTLTVTNTWQGARFAP